jgi:hypothetical protein
MPSRQTPIRRKAIAQAAEIEKLRPVIQEIVRTRHTLRDLSGGVQAELIDALVDAVGFAKAGLADILAGKEVKPAAWMRDILVTDVCDALRKAGVPVQMQADPACSHAQSLVKVVAEVAGLECDGTLYHQMQYQQPHHKRRIKKTRLPDVYIEYTIRFDNDG